MTKTRVVVYGMSTEGYAVACRMALAGADVSIIDETSSSSIPLTPEIAKTYPDISSLTQDEPILTTEPVEDAITHAHYLFFAPRIRKAGPDMRIEMHSKFKDAASTLPKGASFVYCVPTGIGGNNENISLLEHVTGHTAGKSISYFYCPLGEAGSLPDTIGTYGTKPDERLATLLTHGKSKIKQTSLVASENFHAIRVISKFTHLSSILEVCKGIKDDAIRNDMATGEISEMYLHDMIGELYDLRALVASFEGGGTLFYLVNGGTKGIDAYIKRLIQKVRETLKKNDLKAARTKVAISWTLDDYEMRGERKEMMRQLISRLRDYIGDVEMLEDFGTDMIHNDKTMIVIVCSEPDLKRASKKGGEVVVIKANPMCDIVEQHA